MTWKAPLNGAPPVEYRIYRDVHLTQLVATVPGSDKLKFKDRHRKKHKTYVYCVVSVDEFGNTSEPVCVKVKGK